MGRRNGPERTGGKQMTDHVRDAAMRTCDRQALMRSYHMADKMTWIDVVGVLIKPSTLISLSILGLMVWALCKYSGQ